MTNNPQTGLLTPPVAKRIPHPHTLHGDVREDDYYWLKDRDKAEVIAYLEAENQYYEQQMQTRATLTETLYQDMFLRTPAAETDVAAQDGEYYYYSRTEEGKQYTIYARKRASNREQLEQAPEEVTLDLNTLVSEDGYLSVTLLRYSPDAKQLAYLENRDGTDRYTAKVKDLQSGQLLEDSIPNVFLHGSLEWDATGQHLFYVTVDESQRPYRLWRHRLGSSCAEDALVYEESDTTYSIEFYKSRSGQYLLLQSNNKATNETRFLRTDHPLGEWTVFSARRTGVLYEVEHWEDQFVVLTNEKATNFRLLACPVSHPSLTAATELFPYDEKRYLQGVLPFASGLIVIGREMGLTQVWRYQDGRLTQMEWDEPLYTVRAHGNLSYETDEVLLQYESLLTPRTTYSIQWSRPSATERTVLHQTPVPGGEYKPTDFRQERQYATAEDGTKVPLALVYHKDALQNGPAPLILYGYGSYGANMDPTFSSTRLPLLERGVIYVIAQIRGGSEMGYSWYLDGKFLTKRNTFTDFIAAAKHLIEHHYTTPKQLGINGGSAGGLLMGAVLNMAPELFGAAVADVPFVDVVTTMVDETLPLTTLEWDEWGNPNDAEFYAYMKSYSPYDNVAARDYPPLLVTAGLNDPRVSYWEPAKWVARLREKKTDSHELLLKTHMGAGHFGSSGRYQRLRELAARYAFLLDHLMPNQAD